MVLLVMSMGDKSFEEVECEGNSDGLKEQDSEQYNQVLSPFVGSPPIPARAFLPFI